MNTTGGDRTTIHLWKTRPELPGSQLRTLLMLATLSLPVSAPAAPATPAGPRVSGTAHEALAFSLAGTLAPIAVGGWLCAGSDGERRTGLVLLGAGLLAGPSVGYYYAGDARRANREILTHLAIAGAAGAGFAFTIDSDSALPGLFLLFGSFVLLAHVGYDIAELPGHYRRGARAMVLPNVLPGGEPGVRVNLRF